MSSPLPPNSNMVIYHHEVASILLCEVSSMAIDKLHPLTKSSETGLG